MSSSILCYIDVAKLYLGFEVMETHLLDTYTHDRTFVVQQEIFGSPYELSTVTSSSSGLLEETLHAFAHFTYKASVGEHVHSRFQGWFLSQSCFTVANLLLEGFLKDGVLYIIDCHTDSANEMCDFLGSGGQWGVDTFLQAHACNHICVALGL